MMGVFKSSFQMRAVQSPMDRKYLGCAALAHVKVGKLAIVLPSADQAGVLQVEVDGGQLALRRQLKVRRVGVADVPDVAAHGAVVWLLLELQDGVCHSHLQQT
ncbi:MAG: hypothetical protein FRX49_13196 [Trebouxia sp. A1-2]|nr:MAG: hypothetical protein FRX49_13196 [Trebouxia sp. A1-2]